MDLSQLDRPALSQALDDSDPDRQHFLNLRDGSLWTFVFSESTDETRGRLEDVQSRLGETWASVPSMTTQEAYEEIEDFVEVVRNEKVQDALFAALERKGSLRNFRESILQYPEERQTWSAHRRACSARRLEAFLESLGVEPVAAPDATA